MIKNFKMLSMLILAAGLLSSCGNKDRSETTTETTTNHPSTTTNTSHAYICPMDCENSASNVAGVCPVCGMDLVKNPNYVAATTTDTTSPGAIDTGNAGTEHKGHDHDNHDGHNH